MVSQAAKLSQEPHGRKLRGQGTHPNLPQPDFTYFTYYGTMDDCIWKTRFAARSEDRRSMHDNIGRKSALKSNSKTKGYSKDWFALMLSVPPGQGFLFPLGILASTFFLVTLCKVFSFHNKHIGLTN